MNPNTPTTEMTTMSTSNGAAEMHPYLINEALSRARMPEPQDAKSEAHRSARHIAMRARRRQAREQGSY
jgi:hypothetical protein